MTRRMMIIFYSIMAGHILFACVIVFFVKPVPAENSLNLKNLTSILAAASVAVTMLAYWLYQQQVTKIASSDNDDIDKLNAWQAPVIIRLAMIEGVCLANLVALYLTGYSLYLYFYVATALAMLYAKPRPLSIATELQLQEDQ